MQFWKFLEESNKVDTYKNPIIAVYERNNMIKEIKKSTSKRRSEIKKKVRYDNPASSDEKIAALTYKEIFPIINTELRKSLGKKNLSSNSISETAFGNTSNEKETFQKFSATNNFKWQYESVHPGKWMKLNDDEDEAWSCCMSYVKDSDVRLLILGVFAI